MYKEKEGQEGKEVMIMNDRQHQRIRRKKRPYFYIMKDKEIFGAKQEDGSAIHFIYESDGRLINSAQIVGNITDENISFGYWRQWRDSESL